MTTDILLATFNGATPINPKKPDITFISEQLDSLLRQTDTNWRLLVRDDRSTDNTVGIVKKYIEACNQKKETAGKIILVEDDKGKLGYGDNFAALAERSKQDGKADYLMFCDQDDVWHADKVEKSIAAMHALEAKHGKQMPLLVHTDAKLVYANGSEMHKSFKSHFRMANIKPSFKNALTKPRVQGCTMAINTALAEAAFPLPENIKSHDYWTGLVGHAIGEVAYVSEQTMDYRQHAGNTIGGVIPKRSLQHYKNRFDRVMDDRVLIAAMLQEKHRDHMPKNRRETLDRFLEIATYEQPKRALAWAKEGYLLYSPQQNIMLLGGHTFEPNRSR